MKRAEDRPVSVVQVGIGGMGYHYLSTILSGFPPGKVNLCGVVDPYPEGSELFETIKRMDIPVYPALKELWDSGLTADLVVIASPLQFHVIQSLEALRAGSHVLCEKPLAATVQEADRLIRGSRLNSQWIRIGYQWSYSAAVQDLKKDIQSGRFGRPLRVKSLYLWPRDKAYYSRNDWAGRIKDSEGRWVLDSPANSAMAHDLHNLFFLLGESLNKSAQPVEVTAELYRAYPIENYDTVASRFLTCGGVEILFYATHAAPEKVGPMFSLEFEHATVCFGEKELEIVSRNSAGIIRRYGSPEAEDPFKKLFEAVESVQNPKPVVCGPEAARSQTLCVNGIQDAVKDIRPFPQSKLETDGKKIWVKDLQESFLKCFKNGTLPYEEDFSWAQKSEKMNLENYHFFPGGLSPKNRWRFPL
jgi:predicted dehydrogenase